MGTNQVRRCGALPGPGDAVLWRVWAPRAGKVELILGDNGRERAYPMAAEERGYFRYQLDHVPDGQRYAYRLEGGLPRSDPASLWQPEGVQGRSAVLRPGGFPWTARQWQGVRREDLVFYELHVGTFTPEGTFDAVIGRLDSLRELGVTAVQLMPVAQFPGTRNWGYDGVLPYAVQNSYGGPQGLQRLVDACHAAGLAVFIDVVYNHLGPEDNYLPEFGPYFTDRYKTPWGMAVNYDGPGSDAVRDFVLDNARMWIEEYHADGLRLDAVHAIYDFGAHHILQAIKEAVDDAAGRQRRTAHVIAESDLNDPRLLRPPERGGYGLDGQWSDDFHHVVHTFLTGERGGYYQDFGRAQDLARVLQEPFLFAGTYSPSRDRKHGQPAGNLSGDRFVVCIQNHDQVGNRARGDRFGTLLSPPKQRLASSLMLLAPYTPLLFMGEEYGEKNPFPFFCSFGGDELVRNVREGRKREFSAFAWQGAVPDPQDERTFAASRLSWSWPEGTVHAGLRRLYADLLAARREWPALKDFTHRSARLLPDEKQAAVLELVRGTGPGKGLRVYFNLTDRRQPLPAPGNGEAVLFRSEARRYCEDGLETEAGGELGPFECAALGPSGWKRIS